jgi:MFS family permease
MPDPAGERTPLRRVVAASLVGTTIEWYDFFLYGSAAALVFNKLFFPDYDPLVGTMLAFATYAVGFVARPLGGIVFGHCGDRIGRKKLLMWSLVLMGVATMLIGLLPTYAQIGVWAPIALIVLRLVPGFAVGLRILTDDFAAAGSRSFASETSISSDAAIGTSISLAWNPGFSNRILTGFSERDSGTVNGVTPSATVSPAR